MADRGIQVLKFCAQSDDHKRLYQKNFDKIMAALEGATGSNTRPQLVAAEQGYTGSGPNELSPYTYTGELAG